MTKATIYRRLRALEADQPKPSLGTVADPFTGEHVPATELFNVLTDDELLKLEVIVMDEIGDGTSPRLGFRAIEFLAIAFERRREQKEARRGTSA